MWRSLLERNWKEWTSLRADQPSHQLCPSLGRWLKQEQQSLHLRKRWLHFIVGLSRSSHRCNSVYGLECGSDWGALSEDQTQGRSTLLYCRKFGDNDNNVKHALLRKVLQTRFARRRSSLKEVLVSSASWSASGQDMQVRTSLPALPLVSHK